MAAKKKAKAAPKRNRSQPKISVAIPEGFQMPASAQVPNWDYEKQKVLQGDAVSMRVIKKKKPRKGEAPTTRLLTVRDEDGNLHQVWESAGLRGLFDEVLQGGEVFIRYDGLGAKQKGKNQMKVFVTGYNNDNAKPVRKAKKR